MQYPNDYGEFPNELINPEELFRRRNSAKKLYRGIFEYVETFCYALALMIMVFMFIFRYVSVEGESMLNTLRDKDKLIISDLFYTPKTGDIVVIKRNPKPIIKRVIATEGQLVEIDFENWIIKVDGEEIDQSYVRRVAGGMRHNDNYSGPFYVDDGMIFVMGDNRTESLDSRQLGQFKQSDILGRVVIRVFPFSAAGRV